MTTTQSSSSVPPVKEVGNMNGETMHHQPVDEKKESPSAEGYIPHEATMLAPQPLMNGMPPSQVYVNTTMGYHGMMGIETQFQSLGMNDAHDSSNHEDSEGNDGTGEGSNEEDPLKLFIGQVSKPRALFKIIKPTANEKARFTSYANLGGVSSNF